MGCSFTYGDGLPENETVSYKLANITKRPVYNRAGKGWGLSQLLYQTRRDDFYNTCKEPEYIVYIIDLTNDEYRCDGWHPSASIWDILLPKIINILNL